MHGPRLFTRTHLLALAALMLLPACSPRKPIPSDPPEVRTEAMVRGGRKAPPPRAPQTSPVTHDASDVVVAEAKDETPSALMEPKAEAAKAPEAKPTETKQAEAKPEAAKPVETATAEPKATEPTQEAAKVPEAKPATPVEAKPEAVKPEPSPAAKADAAAQAAQQSAQPVSKTPVVQIASFGTEKNAEAALAWLKEKGYAEARVVRVEQGQAVFHRVQAGPFQDPAAARKALEELKADWPQAFIPAD